SRLAMTTVAKRVFDAMDFAVQERAVASVKGNARFGKTESARVYCQMHPGRFRLLDVPSSNALSDLYMAVAKAFGLDGSYGSGAQRLRSRIEYILEHTGIGLALDEFHFALPQNYTPTTAPARLNWIRTEIMRRELPLVLLMTIQTDADRNAVDLFQSGSDRF